MRCSYLAMIAGSGRCLENYLPTSGCFPTSRGSCPKQSRPPTEESTCHRGNAEALCVAGIVSYKTALTATDPQQKRQRLSQAHRTFERALAADPRSVEAHTELRLRLCSDHVCCRV